MSLFKFRSWFHSNVVIGVSNKVLSRNATRQNLISYKQNDILPTLLVVGIHKLEAEVDVNRSSVALTHSNNQKVTFRQVGYGPSVA